MSVYLHILSWQMDMATVASAKDRLTSQDVVISNKENVQTISVTITNTTTERKSYAKERRGKAGAAGLGPSGDMMTAGDHKATPAMIEAPPAQGGAGGDKGELVAGMLFWAELACKRQQCSRSLLW